MLPPSPRPSPTSSMLSGGSPEEEYLPGLTTDHYQSPHLGFDDQFLDFSATSNFNDGPEHSADFGGSFSNADLSTSWGPPSHFGNSLGLVGTPPPSLANPGFIHTAQSLHDSYYYHHSPYGSAQPSLPQQHSGLMATRDVPRIRIHTGLPASSNGTIIQDPRSPYERSPSALLAPSPSSVHPNSSPSSTASVPPMTPHSPYHHISTPYMHPSPTSGAYSSPSTISPQFLEQDSFCPPASPDFDASRRVLEIAYEIGHPLGTPLVPQPDYRPHTQSDRRRYVEQATLEGPILFWTMYPDAQGRPHKTLGMPLSDALNCRFMALVGRDDPMFEDRGPSVSIRINWPGYAPWSRQIPTRDFRSPPQPVTRSKLARNVAKTVLRFIQENGLRPMDDNAQHVWRVGDGHIVLDDLMLVGLQHVSMGSWQAHLRLMRPL
ncbi:hypothetical protein PYCCODRAFT_279134 [Trametes coccinea BRFM310]|uniref:Uncharacterized protein n=1 Tax=Trametes coccinea (strain BRFM310) TaxID=1353009 RepID=A0A1Y2IPC4_TRAC3|nr:hypothetical protein PYCCODRAFT_279134 [Trametes coccinea BRFM310]